MMDDESRSCQLTEVDERAPESRQSATQMQNTNTPRWSNGQCVFAVPCNSMLNPTFDLSICRAILEGNGFQVPEQDFEAPLGLALDVPSVRRYLTFNSALFHFMLAPVLYVVLWCAAFSTFHLYLTITDYWVLCLSVSLISIFLTTAIIFILHHSNKEINVNVDVRLIQVNQRMSEHKLLVGVADWVQNCSGTLQLMCVYWDMSRCLRTLTEALEESSFVANNTQKKLKERMSHLTLVTEVKPVDPVVRWTGEVGGSEEERPLLTDNREETDSRSSSNQREDSKITTNYSLVPEATTPAQVKAHQLLMIYSSTYVRLLMSGRLSGPSPQRLRPRKNHCSVASLCLCQYINAKVLQ